MKVSVRFPYIDDVVPPRCRKPRGVLKQDGEAILTIPEVGADAAPIAIRGTYRPMGRRGTRRETITLEYRWWAGRLWTAVNVDTGGNRCARSSGGNDWRYPTWPARLDLSKCDRISHFNLGLYGDRHATKQECIDYLMHIENQHLMVDGVPHRPADEPGYVVMTFGLGRNHGGTALMVDTSYNSNLPHGRYFNLHQLEAALSLATQTATERGDPKDLPMKVHGPAYEVLIPDAIRVNPAAQHGDGDPFLNSLNAVIHASPGNAMPVMAVALAAIAH